ncbi:basic proline-rich protein-like [Ursus maritimus]|uniref:Basic proline-rich protein-like n=1 Tax=Ursus maritimus TaxID=29073 RepID=A0A8M1FY61_URSMA|nr:basic proline-rich protein-like [Ursus maritimus]
MLPPDAPELRPAVLGGRRPPPPQTEPQPPALPAPTTRVQDSHLLVVLKSWSRSPPRGRSGAAPLTFAQCILFPYNWIFLKAWQFPRAGWACSKPGFLRFSGQTPSWARGTGNEEPGPDSPRPLPVLWAAPSSVLQLRRRRRSCCVTFALPRLLPPRGPQLQPLPPFARRPLAWEIIPRPHRPGGEGGEGVRPAAHPGSSSGSSAPTGRGRVGRAALGPHCLQDQELEGDAPELRPAVLGGRRPPPPQTEPQPPALPAPTTRVQDSHLLVVLKSWSRSPPRGRSGHSPRRAGFSEPVNLTPAPPGGSIPQAQLHRGDRNNNKKPTESPP